MTTMRHKTFEKGLSTSKQNHPLPLRNVLFLALLVRAPTPVTCLCCLTLFSQTKLPFAFMNLNPAKRAYASGVASTVPLAFWYCLERTHMHMPFIMQHYQLTCPTIYIYMYVCVCIHVLTLQPERGPCPLQSMYVIVLHENIQYIQS